MDNVSDGEIQGLIAGAQRIRVVSHVRPDGDAIGSLLGLGLALAQAGKQVEMVLSDGLPASFRHLPGADRVRTTGQDPYELLAAVDCAERKRAGAALPEDITPDLNIDHHATNDRFARLNLVETDAVATAAILAERMPRWGLAVSAQVAAALLTGLVTDTIGFRTPNVTPATRRLAADLMEAGADLPELYQRALVRRSFPAARYWGAGLSSLRQEGGLVWASLRMDDRRAAGYSGNDDADLINVLSTVDGACVALIFVEQPSGRIKVSWRAVPGVDISSVAAAFGGGGHPAAAGAEVEGALDEVIERVLQATRPLCND